MFEYTSLIFYSNLPDAEKKKYGINDLIKYVPQENSGWTIIKADSSRNYKILL